MDQEGDSSDKLAERMKGLVLDVRREADRLRDHALRDLVRNCLASVLKLVEFRVSDIHESSRPVGDVAGVSADFLSWSFEVVPWLDPSFLGAIRGDLELLREATIAAADAEHQLHESDFGERVSGVVTDIARSLTNEIDRLRSAFADIRPVAARAILDRRLSELRDDIARSLIEQRSLAALFRVERAADAAAESAGQTGTLSLASAFDSFAQTESKERWYWLAATVVVLGLGMLLTYHHIANAPHLEWIDLGRRLAAGLPLAVLLAIAATEAAVHRTHALWLRHMSVQLKTLKAYAEPLDDVERSFLRRQFGVIVFAGPPKLESRIGRRRLSADVTDEAVLRTAKAFSE